MFINPDLREPLRRIATGWRVTTYGDWFYVYHAQDGVAEITQSPDQARQFYLERTAKP